MDKAMAKRIGDRIMDHLAEIEEEFGITFSRGNGKYDMASYSMKITATENAADGEKQDKMVVDFKNLHHHYGLEESDLGKIVSLQGKHYKVVGLKPNYRKYPVIAECVSTGRMIKVTPTSIRPHFSNF